MKKTRIAVLGSGMGALSAVHALTHPDNPRRCEFEITVYQPGWRLGGKGASSRASEPAHHGRIEEHGLHNFFGFYDNAFRLMREVYGELARPESHPLARWDQAFRPESSAMFIEEVDGERRPWRILNPVNDLEPGLDDALLPLWDTLELALGFIDLNFIAPPEHPPMPYSGQSKVRWQLLPLLTALHGASKAALGAWSAATSAQQRFDRLTDALGRGPLGRGILRGVRAGTVGLIERQLVGLVRRTRGGAWLAMRGRLDDDRVRRAWICLNFAAAALIGIIEDGVLHHGFDVINHQDFREWMTPRVLDDGGRTLGSVLMRVMYDSSFAYVGGDTRVSSATGYATQANYEAGTLLRGVVRSFFTYKGAFGWKFNGGCGEVLISPLYEVLRRRGVRFRFFHQVTAIRSEGLGPVETISIAKQAQVRGGDDAYAPLVEFDGVGCWPTEPLWDQLADGERLRASGVDLESPNAARDAAEHLSLRRGQDFDLVILGISAGALPYLCGDLIRASAKWRRMVRSVRTTRTQAAQVWMSPSASAMGWSERGQPITGFWYGERSPLNVWADMSHLLDIEGWRAEERPGHLSYFVSPLHDDVPEHLSEHGWIQPESTFDSHAPHEQVRSHAHTLLRDHLIPTLFPDLRGETFPWGQLVDRRTSAAEGEARLDAQFVRANIYPSDRYVLSVAGSTAHRLSPHDPDGEFPNLYLAGDWTRNGLNCGAMESAVLGGLLAAQSLSGFPGDDRIATVPW